MRKEHKEAGDPLPSKVPPGPDNPLGAHMMTLGWPSYLIHGTNKPYGVGLRSSHGCIRFYPEDIARAVRQDSGRHEGDGRQSAVRVRLAATTRCTCRRSRCMEDDEREHPQAADTLLNAAISDEMWQKVKQHGAAIDLEL